MAAEAEATREAKAKIIRADGEKKATIYLKKAAEVLNESTYGLQLRYLQVEIYLIWGVFSSHATSTN
jgi:erythrocyte band 7 integral membrane protein